MTETDRHPLPPGLVDALAHAEAYPDDPSASQGVEVIQTHLSHVFLTRHRVVKLRKAVQLSFVDFSTRRARVDDCLHEVALNRRLAPDVYLGVAAVEHDGDRFRVRDVWREAAELLEAPPECVVVMRRLEEDRDALSLLEAGALTPDHLDAVAEVLAGFHDEVGLGTPAPWTPDAWRAHCVAPVTATLESLETTHPASVGDEELRSLTSALLHRFEELAPRFEERRLRGLAVDGHGDVHLQHVWFERDASAPVLIDCVEFDPALRRIDAANEVAFLAMDLAYRGRTDLAARFLRRYARARDDFGLYDVVDAFQAYRAAVRGKVAALAAVDTSIPEPQRRAAADSVVRHLALAARSAAQPGAGRLVLVAGTVGSGKSTLAEELADRVEGVVISSDRTRKHLAGLAPDAHPGDAADQGLYDPARTAQVYDGLLERAAPVLRSGRVAILDASFGRAADRERARDWAARQGLEPALLEARCAEPEARRRLARRAAEGRDPSDAGPSFLATSLARWEAPAAWPGMHAVIDTDRPDVGERLAAFATKLG